MKVDELRKECRARGLPTEDLLRPKLQKELREHLGGIQRVPSLLFPNPSATMEDLNLQKYEVIPVEPLHDIKEHISNITKELPPHLIPEEKALFDQVVEGVLSTKEKSKRMRLSPFHNHPCHSSWKQLPSDSKDTTLQSG